MIHIKLFESFSEIDSICNEFGITNYKVNSDGTIDVDGNVDISNLGLKKIPLKFGKIDGSFDCCSNELTTLEGAPSEVGGYFDCSENELSTLVGAPNKVDNEFYCSYNKLTTLKGAPKLVGDEFWCCNNNLITLEGAPRELNGELNCSYNPIFWVYKLFPGYKSFMSSMDYSYLRGTNIVKSRFKEALDEFDIELPRSISGYKYI